MMYFFHSPSCLPGFLVPNHFVLIDHDDVEFLVAIDVGGDDRVADLQSGVDFLRFEFGEISGESRDAKINANEANK